MKKKPSAMTMRTTPTHHAIVRVLAAFLILMVALALLARLVPEMDILFISIPVRVGLGLFMAAAFMPFINSFVGEMAEWMAKLLPV